jgi:BioD-like phosphotransacetylase family protein
MVALYITSAEAAGKTALCAGIGRKLIEKGLKVGFFLPFQLSEAGDAEGDKDADFIKEVFKLTVSTEQLRHIRLSRQELWQGLTDGVADFTQRLKQAYHKISRGKDVVIMEGLGNLDADKVSTLACYTIADALDARVIILLRYSSAFHPSKIVQIGKKLESRLLGVIINFVPEARMEAVRREMAASFEKPEIKVLGILPEERCLLGVTVGELTEVLGGKVLTSPDGTGEIVENIMLGAMTPDSGIDYFSRKANKAVVIRGERADMQLAALQTLTKSLILTNNVRPLQTVISRAEEKHVPIIVVKQDTSKTIAGIEEALAGASFRNLEKLKKFEDLLVRYFDFKALYLGLDLRA